MPNQNILYIGGFELPDKNAAAHRVSVIGKLLRKIGFSVSYLGITHSTIQKRETTTYDFENKFNGNAWSVKYPTGLIEWIKYSTSINKTKEVIKEHFSQKLDVIIAYNYPSIALFKLRRYCKKNDIILLADCTEWSNYSARFFFRIIKSFDTFIRMRLIHKSLDGIIVISSFLFEYYNPKMKNVFLLPPLVDKFDHKWNSVTTKTQKNLINLIYAGSPGEGKKDRLDLVIKFLSKIKSNSPFQLNIIGITKEQYLASFGVDSLPKERINRFFFKGRLSHLETIQSIQNSDYSIFLRDNSQANNAGFPTKFVESITCGVPVLTNSTSNLTNYLINDELGFFLNNKNELEIINSLKSAIELPKNRIDQMKAQCLSFNTFHYEVYEKSFRVFIKNVTSDNS